ncbi:unnamed protein product [Heligmosomoides polygyrus]|uniref:Phlebovirus glycoprotein G2 fusion domain-containing protein n=1 Tax=Heligmosomoides polygyrus TaxID=6339 RepID=A0A183G500_HELPZ|nr:unnamed protein product [Heligmosomoides polygyrus]
MEFGAHTLRGQRILQRLPVNVSCTGCSLSARKKRGIPQLFLRNGARCRSPSSAGDGCQSLLVHCVCVRTSF